MMSLLVAMMSVLLSWAVIGAAFIGLGLIVQRILKGNTNGCGICASSILLSFWLGFAGGEFG